MHTALSIAGSDSSGGAGIQADIKTMCAHGVYAMTAITALTAQNTLGVKDIMPASPEFFSRQIDAVFEDIHPDAVKIGMLPDQAIMKIVAEKLVQYEARNIVLDPVMVATSGSVLMKEELATCLVDTLFPLADIITPNIPETQILAGVQIRDVSDMKYAGRLLYDNILRQKNEIIDRLNRKNGSVKMYDKDTAVLVKGGHLFNDAMDVLITDGEAVIIEGTRLENPNTHGTGCTLSSAIASNLAVGLDMIGAVKKAKEYVAGAIDAGLNIGKGSGPLNHMYQRNENSEEK